MGRYEGLLKSHKSKNPLFQTQRSTHPQASYHVSSGRESPIIPDRILDSPHLSISWCMDCPSEPEHLGHTGQGFTAGQSLPVHGQRGQPSVNVPGRIPLAANGYPYTDKKHNLGDACHRWTKTLPQAPEEPQELELLGSSKAHYCVQLQYQPPNQHLIHLELVRSTHRKDATPFNKNDTLPNWCNYTSPTPSSSSLHPKVLPWGVFLVCGD